MFYAVIVCNREECPINDCNYKRDLHPDMLRDACGGGKFVLSDNGFYCQIGQSVGTAYFFDKKPANKKMLEKFGYNIFIYTEQI